MQWVDGEYVLVALAAMISPTTLTWSVLAIVLSHKPLRTAIWFYLGALLTTLAMGVLAVFLLGNAAASHHPSTPKTWVAVLDIILGVLLLVWIIRVLLHPRNPEKEAGMTRQMSKLAASPAVAIFGAGAALANPGVFIPIALKTISELNPTRAQYFVEWAVFALVALLPLAVAILLLVFARDWAQRILGVARDWLERNFRTIGAVIVILLALSLLRGGIAGLT